MKQFLRCWGWTIPSVIILIIFGMYFYILPLWQPYSERLARAVQIYTQLNFPGKDGTILCNTSRSMSYMVPCKITFAEGGHADVICVMDRCETSKLPVIFQ